MKTTNEILNWVHANPMREQEGWTAHEPGPWDGWHGWDGSLLFRLGVAPAAPSVMHLAEAAGELFTEATEAPVGAVHFFLVEPYGHAVADVCGGGRTVLEAGVDGLRYASIEALSKRHTYLGWTFYPNGTGPTA